VCTDSTAANGVQFANGVPPPSSRPEHRRAWERACCDALGNRPSVYGYFPFGFQLDVHERIDALDPGRIVRDDVAL